MTGRQAKLQEDTNFKLLKLLQYNPNLSQREMAKALGLSFGGTHYCLKALIDKGMVKIHNFSQNQNKFGYVYLLTPIGMAEKLSLTGRFLERKMQKFEMLRAKIESLKGEGVQRAPKGDSNAGGGTEP